MIRQLIPWTDLTRTGIPALKVALRPLVIGEVTIPVGQTLNPEVFPLQIRKRRLRQFYEQRRLEPVDPPPSSQQYFRDRFARLHGHEVPIEPVTPVASRIVAEEPAIGGANYPQLPSVEVPVEEEPLKHKPKGGKQRGL